MALKTNEISNWVMAYFKSADIHIMSNATIAHSNIMGRDYYEITVRHELHGVDHKKMKKLEKILKEGGTI